MSSVQEKSRTPLTPVFAALSLALACGSSSSPSAPGAADASREVAPADAGSDVTSGGDSGGDASDACATDPAAACGCTDTAPFAPADPASCESCLRSQCASSLGSYEGSCWVLQGCTCSCSGFDDTCTNNAQPFYMCGHTACAGPCAGADAGPAGDAAGD